MGDSLDVISEKATSKAIIIAIGAIQPFVLSYPNGPQKVSLSIVPLYGFSRPRGVIIKSGSMILNDFLTVVKRSGLPQNEIDKLRNLATCAHFGRSGISPPKWELWSDLITRYRLHEPPFRGRTKLIWPLGEKQISTPLDLADLRKGESMLAESSLEAKGSAVLLRQKTLRWRGNNHKR